MHSWGSYFVPVPKEGRQQKHLPNTDRHTFRPFWIIYPLFLDTCTCDQTTINKGKAAAILIVLFFQIKEKLFKKWI